MSFGRKNEVVRRELPANVVSNSRRLTTFVNWSRKNQIPKIRNPRAPRYFWKTIHKIRSNIRYRNHEELNVRCRCWLGTARRVVHQCALNAYTLQLERLAC